MKGAYVLDCVHTDICGFHVRLFDALTTHKLYEILRARADVFVGGVILYEKE